MKRTRIKICGITSPSDLTPIIDHGADAVGFVFAEKSPRFALNAEAITDLPALSRSLPPFVSVVGVFDSPCGEWELDVLDDVYMDLVQHPFDTINSWSEHAPNLLPFVRLAEHSAPKLPTLPFLLEGPKSGAGVTCDWTSAASIARSNRIILAGGLTPDNVANAIRTVRPYAVDVSSGVESAPGKKDPVKIRDFIQAVRAVDLELA